MTRQLSHGDHIGCFLEFKRLLVDKGTLFVDYDVWVHWTWITVFAGEFGTVTGSGEGDSRQTVGDGEVSC